MGVSASGNLPPRDVIFIRISWISVNIHVDRFGAGPAVVQSHMLAQKFRASVTMTQIGAIWEVFKWISKVGFVFAG